MTAGQAPDPNMLSSTRNPRARAAAALRDRRAREAAGLTLVDGARELARALAGGAAVAEVFVDERRLGPDGHEAVALARAAGAAVVPVTSRVLDLIAYGDRSEGLVATVRVPDLSLDALRLPVEPLVVVVEGVEKPGNLGAVLRSADAAGADAVIAADPRTDLFNPNAIRASLGTVFTIPVAAASSAAVRARLDRDAIALLAARVDGRPCTPRPTCGARSPSSSAARRPGCPPRGRATASRRSGCRCSASPTASTCRSRPPSCCTRRGASAESLTRHP